MCLSKVYVESQGKRELLMEEITSVGIKGDRLLLRTLFGEQKEITANIREIDFLGRSIILENLDSQGIS